MGGGWMEGVGRRRTRGRREGEGEVQGGGGQAQGGGAGCSEQSQRRWSQRWKGLEVRLTGRFVSLGHPDLHSQALSSRLLCNMASGN